MPEPAQTSESGVHRIRSVFFSESGRLVRCGDPASVRPRLEDRMRESAGQHRATSFLIVDCRLLARESKLVSLLPAQLRARLANAQRESGIPTNRQPRRWHETFLCRMLLLAAATAGAAAGFWIYFQEAL